MTGRRLIEVAFPLEQVSLDSVHEKNVRHGHISTLHIWPARRPLAACRAALIATLLPDPGDARERGAIYRRMAGRVVETVEDERIGGRTVARRRRKTQGGILHWERKQTATGPKRTPEGTRAPGQNRNDLDWFRARIRDAWNGCAPRVLDPFAGGGAIPLEAMRLGCEVTAVDLNPVAWFILKCTLDYPRRLVGETRPLPAFALRDGDFVTAFLQARGVKGRALKRELADLGLGDDRETEPRLLDSASALEAGPRVAGAGVGAPGAAGVAAATGLALSDLRRVSGAEAGRPAVRASAGEAAGAGRGRQPGRCAPERGARRRLPEGPAEPALGGDADRRLPVGAPRARCKGCRATVPLLKTAWLARKGAKRVRAGDDAERGAHRRRVSGSRSGCRGAPATRRSGASTTGGSARAR